MPSNYQYCSSQVDKFKYKGNIIVANANKYQRKISLNAHPGRCHGIKNKCPKEVVRRVCGFFEAAAVFGGVF